MKIFELQNNFEAKPIVYLDMDGVLADMFGEAAKREGAPHWRKARKIKDRIDQVAQEPGFFRDLPVLKNAGILVNGVLKLAGEFSILSSPLMSNVAGSSKEKTQWLQRHFKKHQPQAVIFDHQKEKFARQPDGTPNILIDDWDTNIRLWNANGGIGILYKPDNVERVLKQVSYALEGLLPIEESADDAVDFSGPDKLYTNKQVLKYIKDIHVDGYSLDEPVLKHKTWKLTAVPISSLKNPEFYDQDDPYRRVIDLDWDHIDQITGRDIAAKPVVADADGWVLDGNHRVAAARVRGMDTIKALVPAT